MEDGIDAGQVTAAQGHVGGVGDLKAAVSHLGVQLGGDPEVGRIAGRARGEVVPAFLGRISTAGRAGRPSTTPRTSSMPATRCSSSTVSS
jgi:hypothetical protein